MFDQIYLAYPRVIAVETAINYAVMLDDKDTKPKADQVSSQELIVRV